jgi:tRNA A37 threonylcarbamoyltransferase TsaD
LSVSIFHIGLSLDHPLIPIEERPKIKRRLRDLQERMTRAGYKYEIIQASPEAGLNGFKRQLETQPCDGVLIGGGVAGNEAMSYFMEQIIDATHEVAPKAKIMFYNHSMDVRSIVERWFGSRSD